MGTKYRNISRYTTAVALHERALELAKNARNVEFEILSLNMLGVVYRRNDAVKTALDHNQEALALAEQIENPSEGIKRSINVSLNSIGNIYMSLEQYQLAIEQFRRSLILESELGNRLGLAINHQNIGEAMEAQGRLDDALENYRTSLAYNEEIDSDMGRIICKNSIAQIYIKKGMPHQALEILVPALADSQALGDKFITAPVYINLGKAQMDVGQYKQAEKNLSEGISMAKRFKLPRVTSDGLSAMAELMEDTGRNKDALTYFKEGVQFDEEVTNERNLRYVNDMIMRYESDKKTNQIQVLAQENEIVKLKLRKNRITLIIGSMALALLLGILFILYRQWQLKKEKEVLTLEQRLLRSQMNPHFLFNSLNSIKLYIINNEQKNAVHYLNKFSKLVRKILDASSVREIPLVEELETVELYMNIENIRFSNEIDFKINVADGIDKHQIKVPSLILQPFLENALWHGLSSKEGEKSISVDVTQENPEFLTIRITDNGVGREAAERIKQNKLLKKKSMGIDITKERLANFSRHYQNTFAVDIIDLVDGTQLPIGTQVVLTLPAV
jgi:tetratricopeptide (TPR) repeat protein